MTVGCVVIGGRVLKFSFFIDSVYQHKNSEKQLELNMFWSGTGFIWHVACLSVKSVSQICQFSLELGGKFVYLKAIKMSVKFISEVCQLSLLVKSVSSVCQSSLSVKSVHQV